MPAGRGLVISFSGLLQMKHFSIVLVGAVCVGCRSTAPLTTVTPPISQKAVAKGAPQWLTAVRNDASEKGWNADGTPLGDRWKAAFSDWIFSMARQPSSTYRAAYENILTIAVRVPGIQTEDGPSVVFQEGTDEEFAGGISRDHSPSQKEQPHSSNWIAWYTKPFAGQKSVDLLMGVATGPWQTVGSYKQINGRFDHVSGSAFAPLVIAEPANKGESLSTVSVIVTMPDTPKERAFRIAVKGRDGKELMGAGSVRKKKDGPSEAWFEGKLSEVHSVELQTRDYEWVRIPNIQLQAKS